jgi:hypothetical protein
MGMLAFRLGFPTIIPLLFFAAGTATQTKIDIQLKNGSASEAGTKKRLEALFEQYDLSKWTFTKKVIIEDKALPHSHPVLTLNTSDDKDLYLLSEYIHEQIHWFEEAHPEQREMAIAELEGLFLTLPTSPPDGARGRHSSYLHLLVCYLEYEGLKELAGEEKARAVFEHWSQHHYKSIYKTILKDRAKVKSVAEKYKLTL